jgi:hypothetical protein
MQSGTHVGDQQAASNGVEAFINHRSSAPLGPEEREQILKELAGILNSSVFRSSKRYPALLEYIVMQKLNGRDDSLKERVLGVEVFGRSPSYDTNVDHVVRTAAGEVRKRLALYYMENGRGDRLRIDVPPGSYVPQFKWIGEGALTGATTPVAPPIEPATELSEKKPGERTRNRRWILLASLLVNVALVLALVEASKIGVLARGESALEKFWEPVFQTSSPVLLCVGLRNGPQPGNANASSAGNQQPANSPLSILQDPLMSRVSMADLLTLARLSAYAGERRAAYRVLNPAITSFGDLRASPTVLIGAGNNDWTRQIAERLRFTYVMSENGISRPVAIHDRQGAAREDWRVPIAWPESYKDYAIVSRLLDPRVEQTIVLVGGLGPHGTEAAGEFVTSAADMKKLSAQAPAGWEKKNVQIVISTEVVKGSSGPPKIEATWFW